MVGRRSIAGGRSLVLTRWCGVGMGVGVGVGGTVGSVRRGGGGGIGMGWDGDGDGDGSGQVASGRVVSSRPRSSRVCVRAWVWVRVCTREEDLVQLAQNRESRIAIDLGVWAGLVCPLQAGARTLAGPGCQSVGTGGRVDQQAGLPASEQPSESSQREQPERTARENKLLLFFPSPPVAPFSLVLGLGCRDVLLSERSTANRVNANARPSLPSARDQDHCRRS